MCFNRILCTKKQGLTVVQATDFDEVKTPAYVLDESQYINNLKRLKHIQDRTGCEILLAIKAFANPYYLAISNDYLSGVSASSLYETQLAHSVITNDIHVYSPAFKAEELDQIQLMANHIVFNSWPQWLRYRDSISKQVSCGIRINPAYSEIDQPLYDPCRPRSRFGVHPEVIQSLDGLSGFHVHALCEQHVDVLERLWGHIDDQFGQWLPDLDWINLGGGHLLTDPTYNIDRLIDFITMVQNRYGVRVILEPGTGVVVDVGYLVASVLDIIERDGLIAILDTSATAHIPDILEMPYHPRILGQSQGKYTYQLTGVTCLSGDIIGDYGFDAPLAIGDRVVFEDVAPYTMVKNTTFNGIALPDIYNYTCEKKLVSMKQFGYSDFVQRLG